MSIVSLQKGFERMNQEIIEYNRSRGYLPDMYYYQLNNKSADENYREQKQKRFRLKYSKYSLEDFVMDLLRASLETTLNEVLDTILPNK